MLLGKYLVVSLIGEGGMGNVLKCKHVELDELVAIKCLLPEMMDQPEIVARFLREARAAVKLKGAHVARVHDVGRFPETEIPYIVMEYLDGADLNAIIKTHGPQDPAIAVDLILQACEAIAEAHSLGIIHRDIKASNLFVVGGWDQAPTLKVLDFGIATSPEGTSDLTSTQSVIGTPSYMAPEQMRSSKTPDVRSDIWSIGIVLYELVEGVRPFRSDAYAELCLKIGMDPPAPMVTEVPDALRDVIFRCLEKPLEKRFQTVAELAQALMPFAADQIAARASVEQILRFSRRTRAHDVVDRDRSVAVARPISSSQSGVVVNVLGRPTPMPSPSDPKSATSHGLSAGQVVAQDPPRRRGLIVGMSAAIAIAIGGVAFYAVSGSSEKASSSAGSMPTIVAPPPAPPTPPKPTIVVEPIELPAAPKVEDNVVAPVTKPPPAPVKAPIVVKPPVVKKPPPPPEPEVPGGDLYKSRR